MIESLELKGTFKSHLVQLSCSGQGHRSWNVHSLTQPHFESLQGWGINHISGQPVAVPHHPHCKRFVSNLNLPSLRQNHFPLFFHPRSSWRVCPLLSCSSPSDIERSLSGHLGAFSSLGWTAPALSASLTLSLSLSLFFFNLQHVILKNFLQTNLIKIIKKYLW